MTISGIDPNRIRVYCDEEADKRLFLDFGKASTFLARIPKQNIEKLPSGSALHGPELASIVDLANYDRPDFIFLYHSKPVLVVELTEHGYTGDNPLQRFTRFATTAENALPFIYFTPFSRVRDDELDLVGGNMASKRNVNTNVWKGMSRLSEIFDVPQIAIGWPLAANGKPRKPGINPSADVVSQIFGELINAIIHLLALAPKVIAGQSIMDSPFVQENQDRLKGLWQVSNAGESVTRGFLTNQSLKEFLKTPSTILQKITLQNYFSHDKPERLLAFQCVLASNIEYISTSKGTFVQTSQPAKDLSSLLSHPVFNRPFYYYTGYQWRSDPHCGVVVNLDYLRCRNAVGRSPTERDSALVVFWPRVFYSVNSKAYQQVDKQLEMLADGRGDMFDLFVRRYGSYEEAQKRVEQLLGGLTTRRDRRKLIGFWGENTKQSRIFRQYCDLLVLADAVILGNHWDTRL
jgi:hypothetical protein